MRHPLPRGLSQAEPTIVGSLTDNKTEFQEKLDSEQKEAIFNTMALLGFAMSLISFLDSRSKK